MPKRMTPDQLQWVLEHNMAIRAGHRVQISNAVDEWRKLESLAGEFIHFWTTYRAHGVTGCGMCGGIPHTTTCYVGRMAALIGAEAAKVVDAQGGQA